MTTKILVANNEKCTGCRLCEMVCSVNKEGDITTKGLIMRELL